MTASLIVSVISLCLCISGFFFFRWYIARKTAASRLLSGYRDEVYRLIAEIDAATDRDSLLVEERIKTLRKIIEDTDRRISVYMRELQHRREGEAMYTSLGKGIRAALDSRPPSPEQALPSELPEPQDLPAAPGNAKNDNSSESKASAARKRNAKKGREEPEESGQPAKPKIKVQIAEMAAQGLPPTEIASRLGLSLAEVDLALNLLQRTMGN